MIVETMLAALIAAGPDRPIVVPGPVCAAEDRKAVGSEGYFEERCDPPGRGYILALPGDVLFSFGSAAIRPDAWPTLRKLADRVLSDTTQYYVDGHADAIGGALANYELSLKRAVAVRDALVGLGVPPERLIARAFGEERPEATNATASGRQRNRRVELVPNSSVVAPGS